MIFIALEINKLSLTYLRLSICSSKLLLLFSATVGSSESSGIFLSGLFEMSVNA